MNALRKWFLLLLPAALLLSACGGRPQETGSEDPVYETVELTVWGAEEDEALLQELIASFEAAGLTDALPRENTTGTDRFSPADRYQEIREKVVK